MKAHISFLTMLMIAFGLFLSSCDGDDDEDEDPAPSSAQPAPDNIPTLPMADGALIAVETVSTTETVVGTFDIIIGTGVGVFYDANNSFVNVGNVSLNGSDLTRNSNNSYTYIPSATEPSGLEFNGNIDWVVEGGGDFSGFSGSPSFGFPNVGDLSGADVIDRSQDYTLSVTSVSGADSIIYNINGLLKTVAGNQTSVTFTAEELSSISAGPGVAQAAPYRFEDQDLSGKTIYFVTESVVSKTVTIE